MTRKMADAVNPDNIPVGVYPLVAGYINGPVSQWPAAGWARHAGRSILVRITVFASTNDGHVLDVEQGDATPAQAPGWVKMRRAAGTDPTVYCSEAVWPAVRKAFAAAKVPEPHYWVAAYPGEGQVIPAGAIAHQYVDLGPLDESVVADYWPGVDGGDMSFDLLTALPDPKSVAGTGTVQEALTAALYGIGGRRNGGSLADAVAGIASAQTSTAAALTALATAVATTDSDVKAVATQEAIDHAANLTAWSKVSALDPAALEPVLQGALTQLGWTPPPSVKDIAVADAAAVAPAVLALIASKLGGTA